MFIWAEMTSQDGEAVGTDLWGDQKKDLRLRGTLVVLTGMLVDQEEVKPDLGRFLWAESRAAVESWFVFIDKWKASFTLEERMFFSGDQKTWVLKQRLEERRNKEENWKRRTIWMSESFLL